MTAYHRPILAAIFNTLSVRPMRNAVSRQPAARAEGDRGWRPGIRALPDRIAG